MTEPLTTRQLQILEFERNTWSNTGPKESAVREWFGISLTRYTQVLNQLIDHPAAVAYDPELVNRLRRLAARRADLRRSPLRRLP